MALFIGMKTQTFDIVDRGILIGNVRKRGVKEGLVNRCEELLRETKSKVRMGDREGNIF